MSLLQAEGVESALINLGGNAYALGKKNEFDSWNVGIQDPRNENRLLGSVRVENKCVITSGDYQRYFELDGVRYHHIMNPNTGTALQQRPEIGNHHFRRRHAGRCALYSLLCPGL